MDKIEDIKKILWEVENVCREAVRYVGSANYPEREAGALRWVSTSFKKLAKQIADLDKPVESLKQPSPNQDVPTFASGNTIETDEDMILDENTLFEAIFGMPYSDKYPDELHKYLPEGWERVRDLTASILKTEYEQKIAELQEANDRQSDTIELLVDHEKDIEEAVASAVKAERERVIGILDSKSFKGTVCDGKGHSETYRNLGLTEADWQSLKEENKQ